jgi:isopropylmalate/homocitrate/citramalate synthase
VLAVAAGVEIIQTTVAGTGERAGNTPMEETVLTLLTMYGLDLGIKTERFTPLAQEVLERMRVQEPSNRPVVGDRLFDVESGIIAGWVRNVGDDLVEAFPFRPELVGQRMPRVVLGKGSGIDSIAFKLDQMGITATNAEMLAVLAEVKARSLERKGLLDDDELRKIVDRTVKKVGV